MDFNFDFVAEAPGPLLKTSDEVIQSIVNIDKVAQEHDEALQKFRKKFCEYEKGTAFRTDFSKGYAKSVNIRIKNVIACRLKVRSQCLLTLTSLYNRSGTICLRDGLFMVTVLKYSIDRQLIRAVRRCVCQKV